ncbi:MAG: ABC transporter permease subunit [Pseudomonadota bacterium]
MSTSARVKSNTAAISLPLSVFLVLIAALEVAKHADLVPITIPAPSQIAGALPRAGGDLLFHMQPTVIAAVSGLMIGVVLALLCGAMAAGRASTEPVIFRMGLLIDSIPLIALTPILMLWIGTGMTARITIAALATFFPLLVGAIQGMKAADQNAVELFHVMAASRRQRLVKLQIPSALPYLFAAFRIAAPLAVLGALIAEWGNAERGLGIMMVYALFSFDVPLVWLTIITVCLLAMTGYASVALAEKLLVHWAAPADPIKRPT